MNMPPPNFGKGPDTWSPVESNVRMPGAIQALTHDAVPGVLRWARLLLARKFMITLLAAMGAILAAMHVSSVAPIYRASATVLVEVSNRRITNIEEVYGGITANREHFRTQVEALKSRETALETVAALDLFNDPAFSPSGPTEPSITQRILESPFVQTTIEQVKSLTGQSAPEESAESSDPSNVLANAESAKLNRAVGKIRSSLIVSAIPLSHLIRVSYESTDPEVAARVATGVANGYIKADLEARFDIQKSASVWLIERLEQLRVKLDVSEKALQEFKEKAGIIDSRNSSSGSTGIQLNTASQRLVDSRLATQEAYRIYRQVRPGAKGKYEVPAVFNNPAVATARQSYRAAQSEFEAITGRLGPQHPRYIAAQSALAAERTNYFSQAQAVIASIAKRYELAKSNERALEAAIAEYKSGVQDISRREVGVRNLEREVATSRQLYETFLSRVKETSATSDFLNPVARVVEEAQVPLSPSRPNKRQVVMLGGLLGIMLGTLLAILFELRRSVVRSTDDVSDKLSATLLAAIPRSKKYAKGSINLTKLRAQDPIFTESIRSMVTGTRLAMYGEASPVIAVTSSIGGEGKSTIVAAFAAELARTQSVVVVDADLRKPTLSMKLNVHANDNSGLTDVLRGKELNACVTLVPEQGHHFISAGSKYQTPLDLLMSPEFPILISKLQARYDIVVIDTPPVGLVSDALIVGQQCTTMIYVIKSNATPVATIRQGLSQIESSRIPLLGTVLNQHSFEHATKYYGDSSAHGQYAYDYGHEK